MSTVLHGHAPDPPTPDPPCPRAGGRPAAPVDVQLLRWEVEHADRSDDVRLSDRELIDQIAELESLQHAVAALQADRIRTFARAHAAARIDADTRAGNEVEPEKLERSIAAQIGLACRISPTQGRSRLRTARVLHSGLDHVQGLFTAGELSPAQVAVVVGATADLDGDERNEVDRRLAERDLPRLGLGRLRDLVRMLAAQAAPEKFRARTAAARAQRRVTLRPAADGMTWLTAYLPTEQGVACQAALTAAHTECSVSPQPLTRSRGQVMADTLVERVTGQATAQAVNVEVQALIPVDALIDPDCDLPPVIPGHGPVPIEHLLGGKAGHLALRRLITRHGVVIGGDSRRRCFSGLLADLVRARDRHRCREPYCDAPVRHIDHIRRHADGGATTLDNGRAVCEFHNQVREQPGWTVRVGADGIRTTTPTGHTYLSPVGQAA